MYNSSFTVDLNVIKRNYRAVLSSLPGGCSVIPVLKRDAFGYGAARVSQALLQEEQRPEMIALAHPCEGLELRRSGADCELLILGAFLPSTAALIKDCSLQATVFTPSQLEALNSLASPGNRIGIQIKIETGLNRIGVRPGEELSKLLATLKRAEKLELKGVYSHFSDSENYGSPLAGKQLEIYKRAVEQIEAAGFEIPLKHMCNSAASEWFEEAFLDAVRIGRRLYMGSRDHVDQIEETGTFKTEIVNLKTVKKGESVGYDGAYVPAEDTLIATLPIGYGDGLHMGLPAAGAPLLINGQRARYAAICMDQCMVDAGGISCSVGDEAVIFGRASGGEFLSSQEVAKHINDEGVLLTSFLGSRVERIYQ